MYEYYTPKTNKLQGFLNIFTFFVDYDKFYVNTIMSTNATSAPLIERIFILSGRCWAKRTLLTTKYSFCKKSFRKRHIGK